MHAQCCPVCHGKTTVPASFYGEQYDATGRGVVTCKSCKGDGYVLVPGDGSSSQWHPVPYPQPTAPAWSPNWPFRVTSGGVMTSDKSIKTITINGGASE